MRSVNWTGEDLSRSTQSQSQPALRAVGRVGVPMPPPRRPLSSGHMVRSRSTDVVADDPRPPPRHPFTKQKTLAEGTVKQYNTDNDVPEYNKINKSCVKNQESNYFIQFRYAYIHI
jgi:hypothetical protein